VALSGLRRPGRRLLGLSGRLGRPLLAGLATTLFLRPLLTWLRLPALLALLLLALAHAISSCRMSSSLEGPQLFPPRGEGRVGVFECLNIWPVGAIPVARQRDFTGCRNSATAWH